MNTSGKVLSTLTFLVILGLSAFVFFKFYFVYSEGVNEGDINYFQKEGFLFKTYEGKMIQTGYNSKNTNSTIQSNEFKFSVVEERIAAQLNEGGSEHVKLHWKRYLGTLPWRGKSEFVVDSIYSMGRETMHPSDDVLDFPTN